MSGDAGNAVTPRRAGLVPIWPALLQSRKPGLPPIPASCRALSFLDYLPEMNERGLILPKIHL
jgi:hypothetical protein